MVFGDIKDRMDRQDIVIANSQSNKNPNLRRLVMQDWGHEDLFGNGMRQKVGVRKDMNLKLKLTEYGLEELGVEEVI